ncbi:MAG: DUF2508 family protein [Bacillota bacterium]
MNELLRELRAAAREMADAHRALDMAAPDYVDSAVYRVNAAHARYSALLRELRRGGGASEGVHRDQR